MDDSFEGFPARNKRRLLIFWDLTLVALCMWAAIAVRHGTADPGVIFTYPWMLLISVTLAAPLSYAFGLYRTVLLYLSTNDLLRVVGAVSVNTTALTAAAVALAIPQAYFAVLAYFWLFGIVTLAGSRMLLHTLIRHYRHKGTDATPVIVYGAGSAGAELVKSLQAGARLSPVAFVDDNTLISGRTIHGLHVFPPSKLDRLLTRFRVRQILLAIPSASKLRRKQVLSFLEPFGVHVRTVPPLSSLLCGNVPVDDVRDISVEEILGREPVAPQRDLLEGCIHLKTVMVTGAGGSIGSELCRQIVRLRPSRLLLFESSEYALYEIERELRESSSCSASHRIEFIPLLGSVLDENRLASVLESFSVHTLFHAAAYKHVPLVEYNLTEGVRNNVLGTWYTARQAMKAGVDTFILISTDKAVRPANVMGAAKRTAELLLQALAAELPRTRFSMVRFGNVLGSSGSVVPLFRTQIERGGPVTVTHPEVVRYFMTIPEAAQLVIQAGSMAGGGDVFVLDMGEPVRIVDLARRMILLSGNSVRDESNPAGDIDIEFTGLRPGEKLYEELVLGNNITPTNHPRIMRAHEPYLTMPVMEETLSALQLACQNQDCDSTREILRTTVQDYLPSEPINDLVWKVRNPTAAGTSASNILVG